MSPALVIPSERKARYLVTVVWLPGRRAGLEM
jgi:hypothetical protein